MNTEKIASEIAALERKKSGVKNATLIKALESKITRLKNDLEGSKVSTSQLASKLLRAKAQVKAMSRTDFDELIRRLARKPEYRFLRSMTKTQIKDDLERPAKPVGWRFKGRGNYATPSKKQVREGKKDGTVYFENRRRRSDVSKVAQLQTGGNIDSLSPSDKKMARDAAFANEKNLSRAKQLMHEKLPTSKHASVDTYIDGLFKFGGKTPVSREVEDVFFKWDEIFDNNRHGIEQGGAAEGQKILIGFKGLNPAHRKIFIDWAKGKNLDITETSTDNYKIVFPEKAAKGMKIEDTIAEDEIVSDIAMKWDSIEVIEKDMTTFLIAVKETGGKELWDETVSALESAIEKTRN